MYLCFGDDSVNKGLLAYIIIGIEKRKIPSFVEAFQQLKIKYEVPSEAILHCRKLFSGDQRKKASEFAHLDLRAVNNLSAEIIDLCRSHEMPQPIFSCAEKKYFPAKLSKKQRFIKENNFQLDEKQGLHFLKNACLLHLYNLLGKDETKFEFYADKLHQNDKSCKNALSIGGTKTRAKMPNFMLPTNISGKDEGVFRITQLDYNMAPVKQLYEIADFFVYAVTKALCKQCYNGKDFFIQLYRRINPIRVLTDFNKQNGGSS